MAALLPDASRDALEAHLFECDVSLDLARTLEAARNELASRPNRWSAGQLRCGTPARFYLAVSLSMSDDVAEARLQTFTVSTMP